VDRDELLNALRAFENQSLEYVLIGATAMGFHGLVRATEDVDLLIRPTPENVERLRRALGAGIFRRPECRGYPHGGFAGRLPRCAILPAERRPFFDILTRLGDSARYETVESEVKEVEGVRVRVATPQALYRLKRDQDPIRISLPEAPQGGDL